MAVAVQCKILVYFISIQILLPLSVTAARVKRVVRKTPPQPKITVNTRPAQRNIAKVKVPAIRRTIRATTPVPENPTMIISHNPITVASATPVAVLRPHMRSSGIDNNKNRPSTPPKSKIQTTTKTVIPNASEHGKQATEFAQIEPYSDDDSEQLFNIISELNSSNSQTKGNVSSNPDEKPVSPFSDVDVNKETTQMQRNTTIIGAGTYYSCDEFTLSKVEITARPINCTVLHKADKTPYQETHDL